MAFNINAEVILSGPKNLSKVRSAISKGLQGVSVPVNVTLSPAATKGLSAFNAGLTTANTNLKALNTNAKTAQKSVAGITGATSKVSTANNQLAKSATNAAKGVSKVTKNVSEARSEIKAFGKDSALAIRRFAAFTIATGAIFGFVRAVQQGVSEAISFQREMVKITQVTGAAGKQLDGLTKTIDQLSTSLGVNANELLDVARTFAQTGQSLDQVQASLRAVARASLAPTFGGLQQSTEGIIAALNQFNITADKTEEVLGSINAVSKRFAVESEDIISVIRRAGGVFAASTPQFQAPQEALNELIAIFTAVRATTRESADSIGTGLRTIFARIQRPQTIEFLKQFNIELTDTQGKFIGFFNAFKELSDKLSAVQRRGDTVTFGAIVEELGGIRQLKNLIPAIVQFEKAEKARAVALAGTKSISKDVALAQQTLAVQIDNLRNRFGKLIRDIASSTTFQNLAKFAIGAANAFITLADALRPALPLLTTFATIKLTGAAFDFAKGFIGGVRKGGGAGGAGAGLGNIVTGGGGGGAAATAQKVQAKATQTSVSSNTQATQANTTQLAATSKSLGALSATITKQGTVVASLSQKMVALTAAVGSLPAKIAAASAPLPIGPGRRKGGGGAIKRFGGGGSGHRKRFAQGGPVRLADTKTAGFAVNDFLNVPSGRFISESINVSTTDILNAQPNAAGFGGKGNLNKQFKNVIGSGKKIAPTKALGQAFGAGNIPRKGIPISFRIQGLADAKTKDRFDTKLNKSILQAVKSQRDVFAKELGVSGADTDLKDEERFLQGSAAQTFKGIVFENAIRALNNQPLKKFDKDPGGGGNSPFDFQQGIGELAGIFDGLGGVSFVDARQSKSRAGVGRGAGTAKGFVKAFTKEGRLAAVGKAAQQLAIEARPELNKIQAGLAKESGGEAGVRALLTPGELVFMGDAVRDASLTGLRRLNKTGDASQLGQFDSNSVSIVPGTGSGDTVPSTIPANSYVIRKKSVVESGLLGEEKFPVLARSGGSIGKTKRAGSGGSFSRQRFQTGGAAGGLGLAGLAQSAVGVTLAFSVLQSLDFSSFEGFVNGIASAGVSLALLVGQFANSGKGVGELNDAASGAAAKVNELTAATDSELKSKVASAEKDAVAESRPVSDAKNQRDIANEKLRRARQARSGLGPDASTRVQELDRKREGIKQNLSDTAARKRTLVGADDQIKQRQSDVSSARQQAQTLAGQAESAKAVARGRLEKARSGKAGRVDASGLARLEQNFDDASAHADGLNKEVSRLGAKQDQLTNQYAATQTEIGNTDKALDGLTKSLIDVNSEADAASKKLDKQKKLDKEVDRKTKDATGKFSEEEKRRRSAREGAAPEKRAELARREARSQRRRSRRSLPRRERVRQARTRLAARAQRQRLGLRPGAAIPRGGRGGGLLGRARSLIGLGGAAASKGKGLTIPPTGLKALGSTLSKGLKPSIIGAVAALAIGPISDAIGKGLGREEINGAKGFTGPNAQRTAGIFGAATGAAQGAAAGAGIGAFAGPIGALIGGIGGAVIGGITGFFNAQKEQAKFDAFSDLKASSQKFGAALDKLGTDFENEEKTNAAADAADALSSQILKTTDTLVSLENASGQVADAFIKFGTLTLSPVAVAAGFALKAWQNIGAGLEAEFGIINNLKAFGDGIAAALGSGGAKRSQKFRAAEAGDRRRGEAVAASLKLVNEEDIKKAEEAFSGLTDRIIDKLSLEELQALPDLSDLNIDQISEQIKNVDGLTASTDAFGKSTKKLFDSLAAFNVTGASKRLQTDIGSIAGDDENVKARFDQFLGSSDDAFRRALSGGKGVDGATEAFRKNLVSSLNNRLKGKLGDFNLDTSSLDAFTKSINDLSPKKAKGLAEGLGITTTQLGQLTQATNTYIDGVTDGVSELLQAKKQAKLIERTFTKLVHGIDAFGQAVDQLARQIQNAVGDLLVTANNVKTEIDRILSGDVTVNPREQVNPFTDIAGRSTAELDAGIARIQKTIAAGRPQAFGDLSPLIRFTRDLPFTLKRLVDNLEVRAARGGGNAGAANFNAPAIFDEFKKVAGGAFQGLPKVVQDDIRNSFNAIFAGRQGEGAGAGGLGINKIREILESGAGKELENAISEFGETLRAGAESLTASLNQLDSTVLKSANFQLAIFKNRAQAEESIVQKRQQFEDRFNKFINRSIDTRSQAEDRLRSTLERQVNAGGAAGGPGFNVLDPSQLINRRGRLERERESLRGQLEQLQRGDAFAPGGNVDPLSKAGLNAQESLTKALGENAAALDGNNRALETLRDDVSRLEAVESELAKIQESRLNQRQRAQLFASRVGSARSPEERGKVIRDFLKPTIAASRAAQGLALSFDQAAALLADGKQVQDAFGLSDAGLEQVQANATGGIGRGFAGLLGGGRTANTLGQRLFGVGATAKGGTPAEEGLLTEAERLRNVQEAATRALANQNTRLIVEQQDAFRKELGLTAARLQLATLAFEKLREQAQFRVQNRIATIKEGGAARREAQREQDVQAKRQRQQQPAPAGGGAPQRRQPAGGGAPAGGDGRPQPVGDPKQRNARRAEIQRRIQNIRTRDPRTFRDERTTPFVVDPFAPLEPAPERRILGAPTDFKAIAGGGGGIDATTVDTPFTRRRKARAAAFQKQKKARAQAFKDRKAARKERFSGLGSLRGQTRQAKDFQKLKGIRRRALRDGLGGNLALGIREADAAGRLEATIAGRGLLSPVGRRDAATRAILTDVRGRSGEDQIGFINRLGGRQGQAAIDALDKAKRDGVGGARLQRLQERANPFLQQRRNAFQELTRLRNGPGGRPSGNGALRGAAGFDALNRRFGARPVPVRGELGVTRPGAPAVPGFGGRLPFTGGTTTDRRVVPINSAEERRIDAGRSRVVPLVSEEQRRSQVPGDNQQTQFQGNIERLNTTFVQANAGMGTNADKMLQAADKFANLGALQIQVNTTVAPVEVILNGAQILKEISPQVEQMVLTQVAQKMSSQAGGADLGLSSSPLV